MPEDEDMSRVLRVEKIMARRGRVDNTCSERIIQPRGTPGLLAVQGNGGSTNLFL